MTQKIFLRLKINYKITTQPFFYVANKNDIIKNNQDLNFVRIVVATDFIDVETKKGINRFTDIDDSIKYIQNGLNNSQNDNLSQ